MFGSVALLVFLSYFTRLGDYEAALHHRLHAATVKERILGRNHADTVSCLIDCLRLTVRINVRLAHQHRKEHEMQIEKEQASSSSRKYSKATPDIGLLPEDRKNFSLVGLQATEVSRRIDKLNQTDHESAIQLAGRCYQIVALTDLIVAGELDPIGNSKSAYSADQGRRKISLLSSANKYPTKNLSLGSLKYLQSMAEKGASITPTVSLNLLKHSIYGESSLLKSKESPESDNIFG